MVHPSLMVEKEAIQDLAFHLLFPSVGSLVQLVLVAAAMHLHPAQLVSASALQDHPTSTINPSLQAQLQATTGCVLAVLHQSELQTQVPGLELC